MAKVVKGLVVKSRRDDIVEDVTDYYCGLMGGLPEVLSIRAYKIPYNKLSEVQTKQIAEMIDDIMKDVTEYVLDIKYE